MCLAKVKETYDPPSKVIIDGWKDINQNDPRFQFAVNGNTKIPKDKWIKATAENTRNKLGIKADDNNYYEPGFHAYSDEKEIKHAKYVRVFLRGVTCLGTQDGRKVVVARELYLPSDPNGWPPKDDNLSLLDRVKNVVPGNA